jgi:hypothetical protein
MNYLLGLFLSIAGVLVLLNNKRLSTRLGNFYASRFSATFGRLAHFLGWDNSNKPFNVFLYRAVVVFFGLFLLIMAFHSFFGPIYLGSAAPRMDTLLQVQN